MQLPPVTLLTWLLAALPIAVVLVLMVGFRWGGDRAGAVGWAVALAVAWLGFGAGPDVLIGSQGRALLLSLYVLYIIWMALLLYRVVDEAGAIAVIGQGLLRLTAEPSLQLLLLAWAFASFLQGVSGYGVPIAIVAPLLIGLGFPPVVAVASVAIGHSWSVTFGSVSASFLALIAASGLPGRALAPWSAAFLGVACFGCGIGALWIYGGWRPVKRAWLALFVVGVAMAGVQAGLALSGLWTLAGFGAGLAGLAAGALLIRAAGILEALRTNRSVAPPKAPPVVADLQAEPPGGLGQSPPSPQGQGSSPIAEPSPAGLGQRPSPIPKRPSPTAEHPGGASHLSLGLALAPYLLLIVLVAAAELWPWLNGVLNQVQIEVHFPEVTTARGWTTPAGLGRTTSVFGHAGAMLAYVALAFFLVYRLAGAYTPGAGRRIVRRTVRSALPSSVGILTMVGMALTMDNSGMVYVLAQGLARAAGPLYPAVAPFIGLLGAFMTGSNTNSNVLFTPLQQEAAHLLGMSALVILAAQTAGGAVGSAMAPAKVIVGSSTAGLVGQEGQVLKKMLLPGLLIIGLVGLLAWAAVALGAP